jgi:hypothetical protein
MLLGELPGFFNAGEVRFLWRQLARGGRCGCGTELRRCRAWATTLQAAGALADDTHLPALVRASETHSRVRTLPWILLRSRLSRRISPALREHAVRTVAVIEGIAASKESRAIIDSSKSPSWAFLLSRHRGVRLHVLHVVRDPRAVVFSSLRQRRDSPAGLSRMFLVGYHAVKWTAWNLFTEAWLSPAAASYRRLRYEGFAAAPFATLQALAGSFGTETGMRPAGSNTAVLGGNHTVYGNGYRFATGPVQIRPDEEWRVVMRRRDRALVTAITWPLELRYRTTPAAAPPSGCDVASRRAS